MRALALNGLLCPNTSRTELVRRFLQRHSTRPVAETAVHLETREDRVYEEVEGKKILSRDVEIARAKTCPVGQRQRLLNTIAVELDLPPVYPGLKALEESVC